MSYFDISGLTCGYRHGFQVKDVCFSLFKGTFAGVIGRNGSGKSTLFKGIVGDLPLRSGSVSLNGEQLNMLPLKQRARKVAVVAQFAELTPVTVEEYVLMGRTPYRKMFQFTYTAKDREVAEKYMELAGIGHLKEKYVTALSGGEQQMASIACALTQQPELLLLDEPTSHLDIAYQARVMNLLRRLHREEGLTVLMIIHDLNLAGEYCDHLILMKQGRVFAQGDPSEVLTAAHIKEAYEVEVTVTRNPVSGKSLVFLNGSDAG